MRRESDMEDLIRRARNLFNFFDDDDEIVKVLADVGVNTGNAWLAVQAARILEK